MPSIRTLASEGPIFQGFQSIQPGFLTSEVFLEYQEKENRVFSRPQICQKKQAEKEGKKNLIGAIVPLKF